MCTTNEKAFTEGANSAVDHLLAASPAHQHRENLHKMFIGFLLETRRSDGHVHEHEQEDILLTYMLLKEWLDELETEGGSHE